MDELKKELQEINKDGRPFLYAFILIVFALVVLCCGPAVIYQIISVIKEGF